MDLQTIRLGIHANGELGRESKRPLLLARPFVLIKSPLRSNDVAATRDPTRK